MRNILIVAHFVHFEAHNITFNKSPLLFYHLLFNDRRCVKFILQFFSFYLSVNPPFKELFFLAFKICFLKLCVCMCLCGSTGT